MYFFFFQAEDGIRDVAVTGVQTCALPIWSARSIGAGRGERVPAGRGPRGGAGAGAEGDADRPDDRDAGGLAFRRFRPHASRAAAPRRRRMSSVILASIIGLYARA